MFSWNFQLIFFTPGIRSRALEPDPLHLVEFHVPPGTHLSHFEKYLPRFTLKIFQEVIFPHFWKYSPRSTLGNIQTSQIFRISEKYLPRFTLEFPKYQNSYCWKMSTTFHVGYYPEIQIFTFLHMVSVLLLLWLSGRLPDELVCPSHYPSYNLYINS